MRPSSKAPQPASSPADVIEQELARIAAMSTGDLRGLWQTTFGSQPPVAFSRDLLVRAITYDMQVRASGDMSPMTARLLRSMSKPGSEPQRQVKSGSVIVREHKGVLHEVLVIPGGFCWQGKTYDSLSAIARKITGVSWNGPRFFGLRSKKQPECAGQQPDQGDGQMASAKLQSPVRKRKSGGRRSSVGTGVSAERGP